MSNAAKILIVDDDLRLRDLLSRYLAEQGFQARAVDGGEAMRRQLEREFFDLLVLDLMLPGKDGLAICRRLRATGNDIPIIMLTAKGDEVDRIIGLEMGADDYLPKPFNPRELVARIHAVLRRRPRSSLPPGAPGTSDTCVQFGKLSLNLATRELTRQESVTPNDEHGTPHTPHHAAPCNHSLTTGEFALLKALVEHPRQPLSRDKLMELARGREYDVYDRSIDVQISRLRKLVEDDPAKPRYIQTVWGFGYVFVPDGQKHAST